ncbi:MAG: HTH domain-containing protein [Methanomicrobiales archaeon]|nr:HTH domain-containing protein [Methanomicrobiales archaeon]
MGVLDAVNTVLKESGEPLHYIKITKRIFEQNLWKSEGKTPAHTVNAQLVTDINNKGIKSRFRRYGPGIYGLAGAGEIGLATTDRVTLSFTDAAEQVLREHADQKPMHYRDITKKVLALHLIKTQGLTPESTMYTQIFYDIKRNTKRGDISRFEMVGNGYFGPTDWHERGLAQEIECHNNEIKEQLYQRVLAMNPVKFEALIGDLLSAIGFESVSVTPASGDGGIDVRGTLVVGDVIKTKMAVQVKRYKQNILAPVIQQVRGSLGAHEQGLVITTSDFSTGAKIEAERPDATPVALMNGKQLVDILIENNIGVTRTEHFLIELDEGFENRGNGPDE